VLDTDSTNQRQRTRNVTRPDRGRYSIERRSDYRMHLLTSRLKTLTTAHVQLSDERNVMVAPSRHRRPLHPGPLGCLSMCSTRNQGVDGDGLAIRDV